MAICNISAVTNSHFYFPLVPNAKTDKKNCITNTLVDIKKKSIRLKKKKMLSIALFFIHRRKSDSLSLPHLTQQSNTNIFLS